MEIINPERKIPESECKSAKRNENHQKFLKNAVSAADYADFAELLRSVQPAGRRLRLRS
jgi:hypothetical protein